MDHLSNDVTVLTDATAISTPLDRVPLYTVPMGEVPITLLKSSQAVSSSDLLSFGTPANLNHCHAHEKAQNLNMKHKEHDLQAREWNYFNHINCMTNDPTKLSYRSSSSVFGVLQI